MTASYIVSLAVLQALFLLPSGASPDTSKTPLALGSSSLANPYLNGQYAHTLSDSKTSGKLNNIRPNMSLPTFRISTKALQNYLEHSLVELHAKYGRKTSPVFMRLMKREQEKVNTDNREVPGIKILNAGKPFQNTRSRRLFWRTSPPSGHAPDDDEGLYGFGEIWRNGETKWREDENIDYGNIDSNYNLAADQTQSRLVGSFTAQHKRGKRETRDVKERRNGRSSRPIFDEMLSHLIEETKIADGLSNGETFTRTNRGRLTRMPITFGKREEGENNQFVRSERGRLGRMPVSFGKRDTDDEKYKQLLLRVLMDILSDQFVYLRIDEEGEGSEYDSSASFTRISKGSLHRMPLSFGKRENAAPIHIGGEESYKFFTAKNSAKNSAKNRAKNRAKNIHLKDADSSETNPLLLNYQNSERDKIEQYSKTQLPENELFPRLQRSKLERMPISFGKRYQGYNDITGASGNLHKIRSRSRLDRMPASYGKRTLTERTAMSRPALEHVLSSEYRDVFRSVEAMEDPLSESSITGDNVQIDEK